MGDYSMELKDLVEDFFDEHNYRYVFHEEAGVFRARFGMGDSGISSGELVVNIERDKINIHTCLPVQCGKAERLKAAEYLTRANYSLNLGNFEMDFSDGEIRYKVNMPCGTSVPEKELFGYCFAVGPMMVKRYGKGLLQVMFAGASPEEAISASKISSTEELFKELLESAPPIGLADTELN